MKIQALSITHMNSDYRRNNNKNSNTSFKSLLYNPKSVFHTANPVVSFVDGYFQRALTISRRSWKNIEENLTPYVKSLDINTEGKKVKIWDINKDNRKKYLITIHGMGQNISRLQALYKEILDKTNYAVLAPEYYGYTPESKGAVYPNPKDLLQNLNEAIKYLKDKGIRENNISLLGHSFGGYCAAALAQKHSLISKLILVCSMNSPIHIANKVKNDKLKAPQNVKILAKNCKLARKELNLFFNTSKKLSKLNIPVNIIQTKDDNLIEIETSDKLASKCKKLDTYTILEKGGHEMDSNKIQAVVALLKV